MTHQLPKIGDRIVDIYPHNLPVVGTVVDVDGDQITIRLDRGEMWITKLRFYKKTWKYEHDQS